MFRALLRSLSRAAEALFLSSSEPRPLVESDRPVSPRSKTSPDTQVRAEVTEDHELLSLNAELAQVKLPHLEYAHQLEVFNESSKDDLNADVKGGDYSLEDEYFKLRSLQDRSSSRAPTFAPASQELSSRGSEVKPVSPHQSYPEAESARVGEDPESELLDHFEPASAPLPEPFPSFILTSQSGPTSQQKPSSVKTLRVHGLSSMKRGVKAPISPSAHPKSIAHSSAQQRPILSRSKAKESLISPQQTVHHRSEHVRDHSRVSSLEQNIDDLYEFNEVVPTSEISSALHRGEDDHVRAQLKRAQELTAKSAPEGAWARSRMSPEPQASAFDQTDSSVAQVKQDEILLLSDPPNQDLADYARDRYIDYDEVLTSHIKGDPRPIDHVAQDYAIEMLDENEGRLHHLSGL